jgi:uncharacterized membrane protein
MTSERDQPKKAVPLEQTNPTSTLHPQEVIPPGLDSVLRTAGIDPTPELTKAIEISLMMFSGSLPLPPPPILAEYEKAFPGLVLKIIKWTEEQRSHRQALERQRTSGSENRMDRGQYIAGAVAIWGLTMAAVAGIWSTFVGVVIAIVAIGGPTAAIWLARTTKPSPSPPKMSSRGNQQKQDVDSPKGEPTTPGSGR